jgi:hypothetical protein
MQIWKDDKKAKLKKLLAWYNGVCSWIEVVNTSYHPNLQALA